MVDSRRVRGDEMPTASVFAELKKMEEETQLNAAKCADLCAELDAIEQEVNDRLEAQHNLEKEKETQLSEQQSRNCRLAALMAERDRLRVKDEECFGRIKMAQKEHLDMVAKHRTARKADMAEALRLMECGQNMTRHYVMELDGKLEEMHDQVAGLKQRVHEMCEKSAQEHNKRTGGYPDRPDITKAECLAVWKMIQERSVNEITPN